MSGTGNAANGLARTPIKGILGIPGRVASPARTFPQPEPPLMSMPETGSPAPEFDLPANGGRRIALSDLRGGPVVLFLYPRDDTSGCTAEAKDFTALKPAFDAEGATLLGLSKDSVAKHEKFIAKHDLGVDLLSDEQDETVEAYGAWVEKSMYGRKFMGIERTTFLIDSDGIIRRIWRKVKVKGHAEEVLEAVRALT